MAIRFSLHASPRDFSQGLDRARRGEELGYEGIFLADSQMNCPDPFQILAVCALQTEHIRLGNAVTNMVYRDPTVLACSAASLNEISRGRAVLAAGMICVDKDGRRARDLVRRRLANRAHHNFRFTLETVPPEELPGVKRFMEAFDISKPLEERVDPSLVTDYLVHRFSIAGTPEECVARVKELEQAGVNRVMLTPPNTIYDEVMEGWAKEVMPHFKETRC